MSYCRLGADSDVYVFDTGEELECCYCCLADPYQTFVAKSFLEMKEHLLKHISAGHKVPQYALDRIEVEMKVKQTIFGSDIEQQRLAPPERN